MRGWATFKLGPSEEQGGDWYWACGRLWAEGCVLKVSRRARASTLIAASSLAVVYTGTASKQPCRAQLPMSRAGKATELKRPVRGRVRTVSKQVRELVRELVSKPMEAIRKIVSQLRPLAYYLLKAVNDSLGLRLKLLLLS